MPNVVIIGKGPAGISAALYTVRANVNTTVIGKDIGTLSKAGLIENYYGFPEPIQGKDLIENGIAQAQKAGAEIVTDEVVGISYDGSFTVNTKNKSYTADSVIIATGSSRTTPRIKGLKELEGLGVSYCATCDAFFYRGKDVAVIGNGEYAVHEAEELRQVAKSVTILSNGNKIATDVPDGFSVIEKEIEALQGDGALEGVLFKDGSSIDVAGVFIAIGVAGSTDLAKKLGAFTEGNKITVGENMETAIPGLYAAGDCTGGLLQIAKAVYEGAKAGTEVVKFVRKK